MDENGRPSSIVHRLGKAECHSALQVNIMVKYATLCYLKSHGKTLMMHRIKKQGDMHAGKWNGLGGKLLPGETPEACAIREVQEESGLTMINPVLRGILTFPAFANDDDWYAFVFVGHEFNGDLIESDEGVLAWVEDEALLDLNLWEGDRIFLKWLEKDAFFSGRFAYIAGQLTEHEVVFYGAQQVIGKLHAIHTNAPVSSLPVGPSTAFRPVYEPKDDGYCWLCHSLVSKRHCKIICQTCGFTRDCSDP